MDRRLDNANDQDGGASVEVVSDSQWRIGVQEQYEQQQQQQQQGDGGGGGDRELTRDAGDGRLRYPIMFGGPPISMGIFSGEGPNIVYVPRRADQRPGYTAPPMRATIKVESDLHLVKHSLRLVPVDDVDSGGNRFVSDGDDDNDTDESDTEHGRHGGAEDRRALMQYVDGGLRSTRVSRTGSRRFVLQFEFDALVACEVAVHLLVRERKSADGAGYVFVDNSDGAAERSTRGGIPVARFAPGLAHVYTSPAEHAIDFGAIAERAQDHLLVYDDARGGGLGKFDFPLVIEIRSAAVGGSRGIAGACDGPSSLVSASASTRTRARRTFAAPNSVQFTYCSFVAAANGAGPDNYWIKTLKQKIVIDGTAYELAEIYEHTASVGDGDSLRMDILEGDGGGVGGEATDDGEGNSCVVCMSDTADVALLPCKHCCLCFSCSKDYVGHSDRCPICRAAISFGRIRIPRDENGVVRETDSSGEVVGPSAR